MDNLNINSYINKSNGDSISAQQWNSVFSLIQAKINEIIETIDVVEELNFYIDGELPVIEQGVITLQPGKKYTLSGKLKNTKIRIDATGSKPSDNTELVLDGVEITSTDQYAIIYDTPAENKGYKDLVISLKKDSQNIIICTKSESKSDDQPGVIYSTNNLVVKGSGYLAIKNDGGHGLRGTEIEIAGPHIYVDAVHDCIHAGKLLKVDNGYFWFANGNDGFGTGSEGNIFYFGGAIHKDTLDGKLFHAGKKAYGWKKYDHGTTKQDVDSSLTDLSEYFAEEGAVTIYASKNDYTNNQNGYNIELGEINTDTYTGIEAYIIEKSIPSVIQGSDVLLSDNAYVKVTGKITHPIYIPGSDVTMYLEDAYISTDAACPSVLYDNSSKKLKVVSPKDTVNVIENHHFSNTTADLDAIKSENNLSFEMKAGSDILIQSLLQDGIDGGEVKITDSKGTMLVDYCGGRGIKGTAICIGPDAEIDKNGINMITDSTAVDENGESIYTTTEGIVVVCDNCQKSGTSARNDSDSSTGFADIYARQGSKTTKGYFATNNAEMKGALICGTIAAQISLNFGNASNMFYGECLTPSLVTNDPGSTTETYAIVDTNKSTKGYMTLTSSNFSVISSGNTKEVTPEHKQWATEMSVDPGLIDGPALS